MFVFKHVDKRIIAEKWPPTFWQPVFYDITIGRLKYIIFLK